MTLKESGLYLFLLGGICFLISGGVLTLGVNLDIWVKFSLAIFVIFGIMFLILGFRHNSKIIAEVSETEIVLAGRVIPIAKIDRVTTAYRGFNTDSFRNLIFDISGETSIKLDISYVRGSPIEICNRINSMIRRGRVDYRL